MSTIHKAVSRWLQVYMVAEIRVYCAVDDAMGLSTDYENLSVVVINRDGSEVCRFMNGSCLTLEDAK